MSDNYRELDSIEVDGTPVKFNAANVLANIDELFVVDDTLSIPGAMADAKKTGDEIGELKEDLNVEISARESAVSAETARAEAEEARIEALFTGDVSEAVGDWLDAHPEATTTVRDGSLTESKFSDALKLKTVKDYVTPDMFGAVGDGDTDDTTAVKDAMNYAIANNCAVFIPQKTYIVKPTLTFTLAENQSLVVFGSGQKSCLKRKADSLTNKWDRIIVVNPSSAMTAHAGDVIFSNFLIDSNRRNQSNATSDYTYEAAADISIANGSGTYDATYQYIDRVIIDRMVFFDPVADCFNFSGSGQVYVKNIWIDGMAASGRQGTRNDIGFTGNPLGDVWIRNCKVSSIHFEYNQAVADSDIITYHISDCQTSTFTLGGKYDLMISGVKAKRLILGGHRYAYFSNCYFNLPTGNNYLYFNGSNNKTVFDGCTFVHQHNAVEGGNPTYSSLLIRSLAKVDFINCKFQVTGDNTVDVDGDEVNDHITTFAVDLENYGGVTVNIDGCDFDERFIGIIDLTSDNTVFLSNLLVKTRYMFEVTLLRRNASNTINVMLNNVTLSEKCSRAFYVRAVNADQFVINGEVKALFKNFAFAGANTTAFNSFLTKGTGNLHFIIDIEEPLSIELIKTYYDLSSSSSKLRFLKGTTFRGTFAEAPNEWIVKASEAITGNTQSAYKNKFKLIGTGTGDTASRPTCILDKGFQYFDTDLGKVIVWNGTTWINVDGTALAT